LSGAHVHKMFTFSLGGDDDFRLSVVECHAINSPDKLLVADTLPLEPVPHDGLGNLKIYSRASGVGPPCVSEIMESWTRFF
jgi:hypothetical protein